MDLHHCHIACGNFGDDLNLLLWPELFGPLDAQAPGVELWGVGTLLDERRPSRQRKLVLGSGSSGRRRRLAGGNWDVRWVRGPLTAQALGLPAALGLGDGAWLWSALQARPGPAPGGPVGLVVHWKTWQSYDWPRVAAQAGLHAISPLAAPADVAREIGRCQRVLAESLHAAIFADALGVPWAPLALAHRFNAFKWQDWLASIGQPFAPCVVDRALVRNVPAGKAWVHAAAQMAGLHWRSFDVRLRPVHAATADDERQTARQLRAFAANSVQFLQSDDATVARCQRQMRQACQAAAEQYGLGWRGSQAQAARAVAA